MRVASPVEVAIICQKRDPAIRDRRTYGYGQARRNRVAQLRDTPGDVLKDIRAVDSAPERCIPGVSYQSEERY